MSTLFVPDTMWLEALRNKVSLSREKEAVYVECGKGGGGEEIVVLFKE